MTRPRLWIRTTWLFAVGSLLAMTLATGSGAEIRGVSYTFTPTLTFINWSNEAGVENTGLLGGRVGINFGRHLALEGYYQGLNGVSTSLSGTTLPPVGTPIADQQLNIRNYGADVVFSFGSGRIIPYIKTGGGVLGFETAEAVVSRQIAFNLGGGVRMGLNRLQLNLFAYDLAYQLNRYRLAPGLGPIFPEDPNGGDLIHNFTIGAGLDFRLGGYDGEDLTVTDRALAEQYRRGLRGLSVPLQVFYGSLNYSSSLALRNQDVLGFNAGVHLGPYVALSGFYWKGLDDADPVQSWGGEARFHLDEGGSVIPFLVAGAGKLDFLGGSFAADSLGIDSRPLIILGGGLGIRLNDRFDLQLAARNYVFNTVGELSLPSTSELTSNWMFSAGVTYALGGRGPGSFSAAEPVPAPIQVDARMEEEDSAAVAGAAPDTATVRATASLSPAVPSSPQFLNVPVPEVGEIVIRFGPQPARGQDAATTGSGFPDSMLIEKLEETVRAEFSRVRVSGSGPDSASFEAMIRTALTGALARRDSLEAADSSRIEARMRAVFQEEFDAAMTLVHQTQQDSLLAVESRLGQSLQETDERLERIETAVIALAAAEGTSPPAGDQQAGERYRLRPSGARIYGGYGIDSPNQGILGGGIDLGTVTRTSKFRVVPEITMGFGSDVTTYLISVNILRPFRAGETTAPYLYAGVGYLGFDGGPSGAFDSGGVINLGAGVRIRIGRIPFFAEFQGVDFFDMNRLLLGVRTGP